MRGRRAFASPARRCSLATTPPGRRRGSDPARWERERWRARPSCAPRLHRPNPARAILRRSSRCARRPVQRLGAGAKKGISLDKDEQPSGPCSGRVLATLRRSALCACRLSVQGKRGAPRALFNTLTFARVTAPKGLFHIARASSGRQSGRARAHQCTAPREEEGHTWRGPLAHRTSPPNCAAVWCQERLLVA